MNKKSDSRLLKTYKTISDGIAWPDVWMEEEEGSIPINDALTSFLFEHLSNPKFLEIYNNLHKDAPLTVDDFKFDDKVFAFANFLPKNLLEYVQQIIAPVTPILSKYHAEFFGVEADKLIDGFFLSEQSWEIYKQKYQLKDSHGAPIDKTVYDTFGRVALAVAIATALQVKEMRKEPIVLDKNLPATNRVHSIVHDVRYYFLQYYPMLAMGLAVGAGRIMANAGASSFKQSTTLINCTVMKQIPDSMAGITDVLKEAAITLKSGAGVGYAFSTIRPKGAFVYGAGAATSGVLSFMDVFNQMCHTIESAGGRRGAQMATLHLAHPEILDYISAKQTPGRLRYFNLSVLAPDSFFSAVRNNEPWDLWFWEKTTLTKDEIDANKLYVVKPEFTPYDAPAEATYFIFDENHVEVTYGNTTAETIFVKKVYKTINAVELYDQILKATYDIGEPGILYYDTINKRNPAAAFENIIATNPCGEIPISPSGSCLLGSIFLHRFVIEPFADKPALLNVDWIALRKIIKTLNLFLDSVNMVTNLPLPALKYEAFIKRRHGLGITGYADMLAALQVPYGDNPSAVEITELIFALIEYTSLVESNKWLAESVFGPGKFMDQFDDAGKKFWNSAYMKDLQANYKHLYEKYKGLNILPAPIVPDIRLARYTHATSIAPTGTISLTFGNNVANGIEPIYALAAIRGIIVPNKKTKNSIKVPSFLSVWFKNKTGIDLTTMESKEWPAWVKTATLNVSVDDHLIPQATAQKYISQAISKTVNLPANYPFDEFKQLYMRGHKLGLKGLTSFRFNPAFSIGVLATQETLEQLKVRFKVQKNDGTTEIVEVSGMDVVKYDGDEHLAANLFEAIKEGMYGKYSQVGGEK